MPPKKGSPSIKKVSSKTSSKKTSSKKTSSKNTKDIEEIDDITDNAPELIPSPSPALITNSEIASTSEPVASVSESSTARKRKRLVVDNDEEEEEDDEPSNNDHDIAINKQEEVIIEDTIIGKALESDSHQNNDDNDDNDDTPVMTDTITTSNESIEKDSNTNETRENENNDNTKARENDKESSKRLKKKQKKERKNERNNEYKEMEKQEKQENRQVNKPDQKEFLPHEAKVHEKSAAISYWDEQQEIVEITQMRGNFWRTMGFSNDRRCFLYPEEALYLIERGVLLVQTNKTSGQRVSFSKFYEEVIRHIQLEVYLAFVKLKTLEYVAFRHKGQVRSFKDDRDVYNFMKSNNRQSLLDSVVSFDLHLNDHTFSKKGALERTPVGYVIVLNGDWTFSARLMISLLDEAKGVPIIFAAVMPSGNVLLEEFTDALITLNWENIYARPIDFEPEESSSEDDDEDEEDNSLKAENTVAIAKQDKQDEKSNDNGTASAKKKRKFDTANTKDKSLEDKAGPSTGNNDIDNNQTVDSIEIHETSNKKNKIDIDVGPNDSTSNDIGPHPTYNMIEKLTDDGIDAKDILETLEALAELMDT